MTGAMIHERAGQEDVGQVLLDKLQKSFDTSSSTISASVGTSFGLSAVIFLAFCFIRPHNSVVYAPKLRHSDAKHAPPPVGKGYFSWFTPLLKTREIDLVDKIGLDATIFLRFLRMLRVTFAVLTLGGFVLIAVNVTANIKYLKLTKGSIKAEDAFSLMSPIHVYGSNFYAHLLMSYVFDIIICYFLWRNYGAVLKLKKRDFESSEYQDSLHARTLMVTDVPKPAQSDEGLANIVAQIKMDDRLAADERASIARDVMELPKLIEEYEITVRKLEHVLAKHLKSGRISPNRPTMKPFKDDRHARGRVKVDAIEYLDTRMKALETRIIEIRKSFDLKKPFPYGFVSYSRLGLAHQVALQARKKHVQGTTITLAPPPQDLIWSNLAKSKSERRWNKFIGWCLFVLLSVTYIVPNAFIASFLANISNIGALWPAFETELNKHTQLFAIIQGVAAPLVTTLIYLLLPIIMRRISAWQGSYTKTRRERAVVSKLYVFFIFNNLIVFTVFGTLWNFVTAVISAVNATGGAKVSVGEAILNFHILDVGLNAVFGVSTFWISYLLQRNLGALLDLVQLVNLLWRWFARQFLSPTPRELIEWTAPQPIDVAAYYNYFLFYATIALVFAPIQPLILLVATFYFTIDSWLRKYSYMYVCITRIESGGAFWRILVNRMLFATGFANFITAVLIWRHFNWHTALGMSPLLVLLVGFKIYCRHTFDDKLKYYISGKDVEETVGTLRPRNDKLAKRYGHPALTKHLITPMVAEKSKHLLAQVYAIRNDEPEPYTNAYAEDHNLSNMSKSNVGQPEDGGIDHFKFVAEDQLDYANLEDHRSEFGFSMYDGTNVSRPGTPGASTMGRRTPGPDDGLIHGNNGQQRLMRSASPNSQFNQVSNYETREPLSPGFNSRSRLGVGSVAPFMRPQGSSSDLTGLLAEQQPTGRRTPGLDLDNGPDLGGVRNTEYYYQQQPQQHQQYQQQDMEWSEQHQQYQSYPHSYDNGQRPYGDGQYYNGSHQ